MTGAFVCPYCEQNLESVRQLEKHVEFTHGVGAESAVQKEDLLSAAKEKKVESHQEAAPTTTAAANDKNKK